MSVHKVIATSSESGFILTLFRGKKHNLNELTGFLSDVKPIEMNTFLHRLESSDNTCLDDIKTYAKSNTFPYFLIRMVDREYITEDEFVQLYTLAIAANPIDQEKSNCLRSFEELTEEKLFNWAKQFCESFQNRLYDVASVPAYSEVTTLLSAAYLKRRLTSDRVILNIDTQTTYMGRDTQFEMNDQERFLRFELIGGAVFSGRKEACEHDVIQIMPYWVYTTLFDYMQDGVEKPLKMVPAMGLLSPKQLMADLNSGQRPIDLGDPNDWGKKKDLMIDGAEASQLYATLHDIYHLFKIIIYHEKFNKGITFIDSLLNELPTTKHKLIRDELFFLVEPEAKSNDSLYLNLKNAFLAFCADPDIQIEQLSMFWENNPFPDQYFFRAILPKLSNERFVELFNLRIESVEKMLDTHAHIPETFESVSQICHLMLSPSEPDSDKIACARKYVEKLLKPQQKDFQSYQAFQDYCENIRHNNYLLHQLINPIRDLDVDSAISNIEKLIMLLGKGGLYKQMSSFYKENVLAMKQESLFEDFDVVTPTNFSDVEAYFDNHREASLLSYFQTLERK